MGGYPQLGSYQSSNPVRVAPGKGRRQHHSSIATTDDAYRPIVSKVQDQLQTKHSSPGGAESSFFNQPDFVTDHKNAKFFIIKSFSEDTSLKYNKLSGNKKRRMLLIRVLTNYAQSFSSFLHGSLSHVFAS